METLKKGLTPFLVLLCPLIYFLRFFHAPLWHAETALLIGLTLVASLIFSLLLWRASQVRMVIVLTLLLIITLSFFPAFQLHWRFGLAAGAAFILVYLTRHKVLDILSIMASVFLISLFVFPVGKQVYQTQTTTHSNIKFNDTLPPIIHIIFDEHIGVNAIPDDLYEGKALKQQLKDFYIKNGFRLYPNAYSHYVRTYDSIPNLLNFTTHAEDAYYMHKNNLLNTNVYFKLLSDKGYKFKIYQANYINFCRTQKINYESCFNYPIYSLPALYHLPITWQQRSWYLLKSYLSKSVIYKSAMYTYAFPLSRFAVKWHVNLPPWRWDQNQLSSLMTFTALNQLKTDVIKEPTGTVFFAHILLPHSPYSFDANCQPLPQPVKWLENFDYGLRGNSAPRRKLRYGLYENQLRCVYTQLQPMINVWKDAGIWDKATVIFQGDHSTRVPLIAPLLVNKGKQSWQDYLDSFPALYAIKMPGENAAIDDERLSITHLFGTTIQKITGGEPKLIDTKEEYVYFTPKKAFSHEEQLRVPLSAYQH